jgi:hypothetical protein
MNFLMAAIGHHTPVITRAALQWTLVIIYNLLHFASTCRLGNRNSYGHLLRIHYNTSSFILTNNINDYNYQQNIQTYTDINNIRATFTHRDPPGVRFPPWPGIFFKPARCGYILRVTSQASYSPEYITLWLHQHSKYQ